jgi:ribosomal protein L7Ae-like RNA K-turn-binding protein
VTLGHIIGKEVRVSIGITDEGFSKAIMKLYDENKDSEVSE